MFTGVATDREGPDSITGDLLYFVLGGPARKAKNEEKIGVW